MRALIIGIFINEMNHKTATAAWATSILETFSLKKERNIFENEGYDVYFLKLER